MKNISHVIIWSGLVFLLTGCAAPMPVVSEPTDVNSVVEQPTEQPATPSLPQQIKETVTAAVNTAQERAAEVVAEVTAPAPTDNLPATFDTPMAFARQAPFGHWEVPFYEDACEEASVIIIAQHLAGLPLDEQIMKDELAKVEPWELERFGDNLSINTEQVAAMAQEFYYLDATVSTDVSVKRIKQELVAGTFIILPLTGRDLHNPNYTGAGPLYHMLVVRGYDRDQFITNDPGTRLGLGYKYPYDVLVNATHDWNGGDIYNGEAKMIIIKPVASRQ